MGRGDLTLFAALLMLGGTVALYDVKGPVTLLGARTFGAVTRSKVPVVVEFFAPWCGHCKSLAPAFSKAASKLQDIVPFVAVDCDKESNRPLCGQFGVQGFPTIKLFSPGPKGQSVNDYQGERSAKGLTSAALGMLTSKHVQLIKTADEAAVFAAGAGIKVVLVTDKRDTPTMFKSFSQRFVAHGLAFARLQAKSASDAAAVELLAPLGGAVSKVPALLALGPDGSRKVYAGKTKAHEILEWLQELAGAAKKQEASKQEEKKEVPAEIPQVVTNITATELSRRLEKEGVVVIAFFAGSEGGCREGLNKLNAAVHGMQGLVSGVQVDLSQKKEAAAVEDLYSITLPEAGETGCEMKTFLVPFDPEDHVDANEWHPWLGELAVKELHQAALELFPAVAITRITAQTYPQFMAGIDSRAKIILFFGREEPPPVFRALSANFRAYRMDFGLVHDDKALLQQFKVPKVPYLLAIFADRLPDGKVNREEQDATMSIQPYMGPMRYGHFASWLTTIGFHTGTASADALRQFGGHPQDAMVAQVTDQESWDASCLSKGGVCVVAALSSGDAQAAQLEVLRGAAEDRGEQPLFFCWFEMPGAGDPAGLAQFAEQLGLGGGIAPPALAAVAPKKERAAVMTTRFAKDAIKEWLDGLLDGTVHTEPLQQLPAFVAAGAAEEGAEVRPEEAAVEEEFDLSDIMNEEIEGDLYKGARKDEL